MLCAPLTMAAMVLFQGFPEHPSDRVVAGGKRTMPVNKAGRHRPKELLPGVPPHLDLPWLHEYLDVISRLFQPGRRPRSAAGHAGGLPYPGGKIMRDAFAPAALLGRARQRCGRTRSGGRRDALLRHGCKTPP